MKEEVGRHRKRSTTSTNSSTCRDFMFVVVSHTSLFWQTCHAKSTVIAPSRLIGEGSRHPRRLCATRQPAVARKRRNHDVWTNLLTFKGKWSL